MELPAPHRYIVLLHPQGETAATAILNEGSPVKDVIIDFLPLQGVSDLRRASKEAVALLRGCTLAGHVERGAVPSVRTSKRLRGLLACSPRLHELLIKLSADDLRGWTVADSVTAASFPRVHLMCFDDAGTPVLTDKMLAPLSGRLSDVTLFRCGAVTDKGVAALAGAGCVHLSDCPLITGAGVAVLGGVRNLILSSVAVTPASLGRLAPSLRLLGVSGDCQGFTCLPELPALEALNLGMPVPNLSAASVPALRKLVCFASVLSSGVIDLPSLLHLRTLHFSRCMLSVGVLSSIPAWIEKIEIRDCTGFKREWMPFLRHVKVLTLGSLGPFFDADEDEDADEDGGHFVEEDFTGFDRIETFDASGMEGELAGALARMPRLRDLTMRPGQFTLTELLQLGTLETLRVERHYLGGQDFDDGELDLTQARVLASLPLMRPKFKVFHVDRNLAESTWKESFQSTLEELCVPGSSIAVVSRRFARIHHDQHTIVRVGVEGQ